jgi:DNA-binding response OmpR family regulator
MPKVLTVDDSRAIRTMVIKQLTELGCDVDEAEDGEQGLARLEECAYDLIVLDVTMPVLDGPGMLERMRAAGNRTPVLMLTSESKRQVVGTLIKLGIEEYILKPFRPEELRAKVAKVLGADRLAPAGATQGASGHGSDALGMTGPPTAPAMAGGGGAVPRDNAKPFVDVLIVDDMENVHKRLRAILPAHVSLHSCVSAQSALSAAREKIFRVILLDTDIPDVNSTALMNQLRALQSHVSVVALRLRSQDEKALRAEGYDDVLAKPFDAVEIDDLLGRYFDNQDLVTTTDNVVRAAAFTGRADRLEKYFQRIVERGRVEIEKVAAACFDEVIVDLSVAEVRPDQSPRLVLELEKTARKFGVSLRLVGTPELQRVLSGIVDTATIPFYPSLGEAKAA